MNPYAPWSELWILCALMSLFVGLVWGSFFNVCIYRVPVKKSVVTPGSHCYHCGSFLKWYDNIPLLSYLLLRGNCRSCGTHFSARYFFVELLTGLIFLGLFVQFGIVWALPFHLIMVSLLIVGVFTDIDHFILPDTVTIGGFVFAVASSAILGRHALIAKDLVLSHDIFYSFTSPNVLQDVYEPGRLAIIGWSLVCAGFGYGLLAAVAFLGRMIFHKEAMGGGDVKLFAFLGAYLGMMNCIWILFLSAMLGAVLGLTLIALHKLIGKDEYEDLTLPAASAVNSPWRAAMLQSRTAAQRDAGIETAASSTQLDASQPPPANDSPDTSSASPTKDIVLKIARRTARQMHHFPYGPYIAVAALIVLVGYDWLDAATRQYLMLPF